MDTAERTIGEQTSQVYDGFISYSHAADDLLAPRLQAGLQRFAKPWWKRRALRIFRDESSLSANPHLWASITEALDKSAWFVLLLSRDAARSEWVNQEIEYWRTNRETSRILPVVTDGEFSWTGNDVVGSSVPQELAGVFPEEPRWVDLRFARDEEHLDLKDPRFADAVADIAAAMRGVPKDELASEEVRQHRRTVRTAWAAAALVGLLAVAATLFGVQSANNAQRAEAEATRADQEADRANEEADRANVNAAEAERNASQARSRELAAAATSIIDEDPELAMMLAIESIEASPEGSEVSPTGVIALRQAMVDNHIIKQFDLGGGPGFAKISPDGSTVYAASIAQGWLKAVDADTEELIWTYTEPDTSDTFHHISVSPNGDLVSLGFLDVADDGFPPRVIVFEASTGEIVTTLRPGPCAWTWTMGNGFSPDGRFLAVATGDVGCQGDPTVEGWAVVYDTETWEAAARLDLPGGGGMGSSFSADSSRVLIYGFQNPVGVQAEVRTFPELSLVATLPLAEYAALSPDGTKAVIQTSQSEEGQRPQLWDVDAELRISFLDAADDFLPFEALGFSPDGSDVVVLTRSGNAYIFDGMNGRLETHLGRKTLPISFSFTSDGSRLLTVGDNGVSTFWDLAGDLATASRGLATTEVNSIWINPDEVLDGPRAAVETLYDDPASAIPGRGFGSAVNLLEPASGEVVDVFFGFGAQLADGRFVVVRETSIETEDGPDRMLGPTVVWDPETDLVTELTTCRELDSRVRASAQRCSPHVFVWASRDGTTFATAPFSLPDTPLEIQVWSSDTLEVIHELEVDPDRVLGHIGDEWLAFGTPDGLVLEIYGFDGEPLATLSGDAGMQSDLEESPDGSVVYVRGFGGSVSAFESATWTPVARWNAHDASLRGTALSPDGAVLVTIGEDGFVNVWDVSSLSDLGPGVPPPLLDRIPTPTASDAIWLGEGRLMVFLRDGARQMIVSLNVDDLVDEALGRLTRGFTAEECAIYRIDPCPSLEEMRER